MSVTASSLLSGLVLATGLILSAPASAQTFATANASKMSCTALKNVIKQNGAVTVYSLERDPYINLAERLVTRRGFRDGNSVERYVSHRGFCLFNEVTRYRTVTTNDTEQCSVKLCVEKQRSTSER